MRGTYHYSGIYSRRRGFIYFKWTAVIYEVSVHEHIWGDDFTIDVAPYCITEGSKSIHCTLCDAKKDETVIPALGHEYSAEWTIEKEATCTEPGSKSHHCIRCNEKTDITEIPARIPLVSGRRKLRPPAIQTAPAHAHALYAAIRRQKQFL